MFSEEIFNSIQQLASEKDSNNNSTLTTKAKIDREGILRDRKNVVKICDPKSESNVQTLKRKRDTKAPMHVTIESPTSDATSRKQSQTTATILVSKTKTKTGLPLLLKK